MADQVVDADWRREMNVATCFDCKKYVQCERHPDDAEGMIDLCPACFMKRTKDLCPAPMPQMPVRQAPPTDPDMINSPSHYGGLGNPYEHVKVAEALGWDKDAFLYNASKYIFRAGKKGDTIEDLRKAMWYIQRKISQLEKS